MLEMAGLVRTAPPWFVSTGAVPTAFTGPVAALLLNPSAWKRAGTTKVVSSFSGFFEEGAQALSVELGAVRGKLKLFWIEFDMRWGSWTGATGRRGGCGILPASLVRLLPDLLTLVQARSTAARSPSEGEE